jgi:hypothetical protein
MYDGGYQDVLYIAPPAIKILSKLAESLYPWDQGEMEISAEVYRPLQVLDTVKIKTYIFSMVKPERKAG